MNIGIACYNFRKYNVSTPQFIICIKLYLSKKGNLQLHKVWEVDLFNKKKLILFDFIKHKLLYIHLLINILLKIPHCYKNGPFMLYGENIKCICNCKYGYCSKCSEYLTLIIYDFLKKEADVTVKNERQNFI